jgi:hypothetical protein
LAERQVTTVEGAAVSVPELGFEAHPLAAAWYAALGDGPEAQFYTPAMWQRARIAVELLSRLLASDRPSSQMYAALQVDMKALLCDAAELRRLGIEVVAQRKTTADAIDWRARVDYRTAALERMRQQEHEQEG